MVILNKTAFCCHCVSNRSVPIYNVAYSYPDIALIAEKLQAVMNLQQLLTVNLLNFVISPVKDNRKVPLHNYVRISNWMWKEPLVSTVVSSALEFIHYA